MVELSHPAPADGSRASGVSADGAVVGGNTVIGGSSTRPIKWDLSGTATDIGVSVQKARVNAVSGGGTTLVGDSDDSGSSPGTQVTRWTPAGEFRLGLSGTARGVSPDGSVIVGQGSSAPTSTRRSYGKLESLDSLARYPAERRVMGTMFRPTAPS